MKTDAYLKILLTTIAICLTVIVLKDLEIVQTAQANTDKSEVASPQSSTIEVKITNSSLDAIPVKLMEPCVKITKLKTDRNVSEFDKKEEIVFKATLRNDGASGYIDGKANIYFPNGYLAESIGKQMIYLSKGYETEYVFKGYPRLEAGNYYAGIYLRADNINWEPAKPSSVNKLDFTLVNRESSLDAATTPPQRIYPNPASDRLYIESETLDGEISLFDLSGQSVLSEPAGDTGLTTLDVSALSPGIYLLQIRSDKQVTHQKIHIKPDR